MHTAVSRLVRLLDGLFHVLALSVGLSVILTVLVVSYGVLAREVLKLSDVWVTDVTTYLMGYMTFVGAVPLAWQGRHLKVDALSHHLGPRAKQGLAVISCAIVACVALAMAWLSANFWFDAWDSGERSWGMLSLPLWIPYLSLGLGSLLFALAQLVRLALLLLEPAATPAPVEFVAEE